MKGHAEVLVRSSVLSVSAWLGVHCLVTQTVERKLRDAKAVYDLKKERFDVVKASFEKCERRRALRYDKYKRSLRNAGNEVCE